VAYFSQKCDGSTARRQRTRPPAADRSDVELLYLESRMALNGHETPAMHQVAFRRPVEAKLPQRGAVQLDFQRGARVREF